MIIFTRLTGGAIAINPDLIERAEETPDTVITLVDDKKFLIKEPLAEVIERIGDYRAYVISRSRTLEVVDNPNPVLQLVPNDTIIGRTQNQGPDSRHDQDHDADIVAMVDSLVGRHTALGALTETNKANDLAEPNADVEPKAEADKDTS